MKEIAARFAGLLRLLTHDGDIERPSDIRDLLIDRLRDALDRRLPSMPESEPSFIGNTFLVEAVVHSNARTIISRLRHRDLGTWHALKTLGNDRLDDAATKAMLLREARIGLTLRHANLVAIECVVRLPNSQPAIIAEWAGSPLSLRLSAGIMSPADIRQAMTCLFDGLHAMHEAGYVHGDISPANLLLRDDDFARLKIADFGSAIECGKTYGDLDLSLIHISRARAVGDILAAYTGKDAILTEGRADSDPLASNETPEGRETNRRTEILVLTDPTQRLGDAALNPQATTGPAGGNPSPAPAATTGATR